ncbi:MAG: fatty acid desaturase [Acidobacteria bacterium]|nr:fatty acid desaturase [Acidobacteriota bacterium]
MRLGDLRAVVGPAGHRRDDRRAYRDLARDVALYAVAVTGAVLAPNPVVQLVFGAGAGIAVTALFVWAHDAAHGALFGDERKGRVLGTLAMLPSLQPYRLWQHGHNRVHHGFTSLVTVDWIWRPWDPTTYAAASPLARLGYRVERSALGCGWHYLRRVWWDGMVRYRPASTSQRRDRRFSWSITSAWAVAAASAAFVAGGGWAVAAAVVVPWLVFTYAIAFITYLHHTHPTRRFYASRSTWNPVEGHVTGSTLIDVARPVRWLLHDIFLHTPHHLDTRIPYYRLSEAWESLRPAVAGLDVLHYRLTSQQVRVTFAECQLFDYADGRWQSFTARRSAARPAGPLGSHAAWRG